MSTILLLAPNVVLVTLVMTVVWRTVRPVSHARVLVFASLVPFGALLAAGCTWVEAQFFGWIGVSSEGAPGGVERYAGETGSLLAMLVFSAPLEEGLKLLAVWPLHAYRQLITRADSVLAALCVAAGFALFGGVYIVIQAPHLQGGSELTWVRLPLASWAHLFFAGVWAYVLGDSHLRSRVQLVWFGATLFHGMYDHIVLVRSVGTLVMIVPILFTTAVLAVAGVRVVGEMPQALQWALPGTVNAMFATNGVRLRWRWVVVGAFATTGALLVALVTAVFIGHAIGLDFAAANEEDMRANGPLVLLGSAALLAFPVAGYLLAVASASERIGETAIGAAFSIGAVVAVLSLAAPVALVFVVTVAPAAFALACVGAWFGCS